MRSFAMMHRHLFHRVARALATCALAAAALLAAGCGSQEKMTENDWIDKVRSDPSPELESIALTPEQRENIRVHTTDTNLRQIHDDIEFILLLTRPVRFSEYPVP